MKQAVTPPDTAESVGQRAINALSKKARLVSVAKVCDDA
jgi:hypothetical protein